MSRRDWQAAIGVVAIWTVVSLLTVAAAQSTNSCGPVATRLKLTPEEEAYVRKNCSSPDLQDLLAKWQRDSGRKLSPDVQALIVASYLQSEFFHVVERNDSVARVRTEGVAALRVYLDEQLMKREERPLAAIHAERLGRAGFVVLQRTQYGELRTDALRAGAAVFLSEHLLGYAQDRFVVLADTYQARVMADSTRLCEVKIEVRPGETSQLRCS